jgi:hypothetical protein
MKSEIDVMIGAFSMESPSYAIKSVNIDEYNSNRGKLEIIKALDGTIQTFVKTEDSFAISSFSLTSELVGVAISSFNFINGNSGVFPTNYKHQWLEGLVPQSLVEKFTIEK